MIHLSQHFTLVEALRSRTATKRGIKNTPTIQAVIYMTLTAHLVLEPLRKKLGGKPLKVSSFYRNPKLNKAVGGSRKSTHMEGRAVDLPMPSEARCEEVIAIIQRTTIPYEKLLFERNKSGSYWLHIQIPRIGTLAKKQVMTAFYNSQTRKVHYENYA